MTREQIIVLNLVISGIPSILILNIVITVISVAVLNLVISGIPSILKLKEVLLCLQL